MTCGVVKHLAVLGGMREASFRPLIDPGFLREFVLAPDGITDKLPRLVEAASVALLEEVEDIGDLFVSSSEAD